MVNFRTPQEVLLILGNNKLDVYLPIPSENHPYAAQGKPLSREKDWNNLQFQFGRFV